MKTRNPNQWKRAFLAGLAILCIAFWSMHPAAAQDNKTAGGLTVYLGVIPAAIVRAPPPHSADQAMHGGIPRHDHQYHVVTAIFDAATNARVSDATVTAQVSGLGLSGTTRTLEPMEIAKTTTYGNFFNLPGADLYTIRLTIQRPGSQRLVVLDFKYDHRRP
jgi:hypothetical protein